MKISQLIAMLQEVKAENGDLDVTTYNGFYYHTPPDDGREWTDISDVVVKQNRSYFNGRKSKVQDDRKVFLQIGD